MQHILMTGLMMLYAAGCSKPPRLNTLLKKLKKEESFVLMGWHQLTPMPVKLEALIPKALKVLKFKTLSLVMKY